MDGDGRVRSLQMEGETHMAVSDYLLQLFSPNVKGESQDDQYKDAIDIDSWGWTGCNTSTHQHGSGGGWGKVSLGDLQLSKSIVDCATPTLFQTLCYGDHFGKAILHCRKKTGNAGKALEYLKIRMEHVTVSSLSLGGNPTASNVSESLTLAYEMIAFEYTRQNPDGTKGAITQAGWNLAANKGWA
jgi:type VI secretion system secreted protein Hcp